MSTQVNRVEVNPQIIEWAVARAGLDMAALISKQPNIRGWLDRTHAPTLNQLQDFSRKLHVPFGYLMLNTPPQESNPIPFYRTKNSTKPVSLNVLDTIRTLERRQDWLVDFLQDIGESPLDFVGSFRLDSKVEDIVDDMRATLDIPSDWACQIPTFEGANTFLIDKVEDVGIVLSVNGVVGANNYRTIAVEDCRGFVLVNSYAPFMYVNASDTKSAQNFTIIHELAHVWLGESAGFDIDGLAPANNPVEIMADRVAACFLVPTGELLDVWRSIEDVKQYSKRYKVSPIVIARRALELELITKGDFFKFYEAYVSELAIANRVKTSGGNFYATTRRRLSRRFSNYVNYAHDLGELNLKDAYRLTDLWGDTYHKYVKSLSK